MFATIAGKLKHSYKRCIDCYALGHKDTVLTLLQAGARRSTVNNMGKNVIQLGSFVGELYVGVTWPFLWSIYIYRI